MIRASQDGTVTKVDQLQVGDYINAAQPVFSLMAPRVWVEANFKEDQLTYMRPGQPATFKVDAYPKTVFHSLFTAGTVSVAIDSSGATDNFVTSTVGNSTSLGINGLTIDTTTAAATAITKLNSAITTLTSPSCSSERGHLQVQLLRAESADRVHQLASCQFPHRGR